jgi:hypothetical protein
MVHGLSPSNHASAIGQCQAGMPAKQQAQLESHGRVDFAKEFEWRRKNQRRMPNCPNQRLLEVLLRVHWFAAQKSWQ